MAELRVGFDHYATIEVERYETSTGAAGFRARVADSPEIEHAPQEVAPTVSDVLRALAEKLEADSSA